MPFKSLGLNDALVKAVDKKGYSKPSVIQEKVIPVVIEGRDVLASAQTGTGKTAGFTLPILEILERRPIQSKKPRVLILTPTRELAAQVHQSFVDYGTFLNYRTAVIFGGVNQNPQVRQLKAGVDVLIATPGRLLDLHNQRHLSLSSVEILVLDEADRMLDMGFKRDIMKVLDLLPKRRQNLLFSATFSKQIKQLAHEFMHKPLLVEAQPENSTADKIAQRVVRVDKTRKTELLIKMISEGDWSQVLVFTRMKHGANRLSEKLTKAGISAAAIHGNKSQSARTKALADFKKNDIRVLVATDIAARGLDIPLLPHVVNFELPNIAEDYVHRIGRTGRAGASGEALSLVSADELSYLQGIQKLLQKVFKHKTIEGFEPTEDERVEAKKTQQHHGSKKKKPFSKNKPHGGNRKHPSKDKRNKSKRR